LPPASAWVGYGGLIWVTGPVLRLGCGH